MTEDLLVALREHNLPEDEVGLREALDDRVAGWELFRLPPAAARRWKCRYRLILNDGIFDAQSPAEAYARAVLSVITPVSPAL
jgi:hypothetical protein